MADPLEDYRIHFGGEMSDARAAEVVAEWRAAAQAKAPEEEVELAAAFQRHYTKLGTGLPPNFCLALTPTEVIAFKFDPRNARHPLSVGLAQFGKERARWPRASVRVPRVRAGRLAFKPTFEVTEAGSTRTIPCRTPRLRVNPAAAAALSALGAPLPAAP